MVTAQAPVPVHDPLQPVKVAPLLGVAESDTAVFTTYVLLQVAPQDIPAGFEVMVPPDPPLSVVVKVNVIRVKVAETVRALVAETVQVFPETESHPVQPARVDVASGTAVRTIESP